MKRLSWCLALLSAVVLGGVVGVRSARANACFANDPSCTLEVNNYGNYTGGHTCVGPCEGCGGDECERDQCNNATCGGGYGDECVSKDMCGMMPDCGGLQCL
jgi:hypothetical protein